MRAAVHGGQDADVVARRHAPVRAADALERRRWIDIVGRLRILAEGIILGEIAHPKIMDVDMLPRLDRLGGEADDLVVAPHRLAHAMRSHGHLVPGGDATGGDKAVRDRRAWQQARTRDEDAVVGMKTNDRRYSHGISLFRPLLRSVRPPLTRSGTHRAPIQPPSAQHRVRRAVPARRDPARQLA